MKILLDENIDVRFKRSFPVDGYEVYTVNDMKWNGIKNGILLGLLQEHNFDCWIVADKNLPYQQNTINISCTIVVLNVVRNTLKHITPLVPEILAHLGSGSENKVVVING